MTASLREQLDQAVRDADARMGVTGPDPFTDVAHAMRDRVKSGLSGGLGFTYTDIESATTPFASFPWARSLVVVAVPYLRPGDGPEAPTSPARSVARFADGDRYASLRDLLHTLVGVIVGSGHRAEAVFDDDRLVDRAVAVRAGIAWWGKSTMALAPGFGPWFLIGTVVTDAVLDETQPMVRSCGSCDDCMPACPTGAIVAPGVLDARRCIAAVLQTRGDIPIDLRPAIGGRVYGCDACLTSCPPGTASLGRVSVSVSKHPRAVLACSDRELDRTHAHWYVPGRSMRFVRRNALVALGNVGDERDLPVVAGYLGHPDALLRSHAAWALGRLGGSAAESILGAAQHRERDTAVVAAIEEARAACTTA